MTEWKDFNEVYQMSRKDWVIYYVTKSQYEEGFYGFCGYCRTITFHPPIIAFLVLNGKLPQHCDCCADYLESCLEET